MTKPQQDTYMADYNRLMFGGNYELVRVENPANAAKAHGAENSFVFIREVSGKTITQTGKPRKNLQRKIKDQTKPVGDINSRIKLGGYMRREEAAKYLGISLRTLTDWQQNRIIPFRPVSHRVTLFRLADLDEAMKRFLVKAIGEKT